MLSGIGLCSIAVVPRNNSAQSLFPLDLAFGLGREIGAKNFVADIHSLMRTLVVIVRQPLPVDVIKLVKAHANEVIQAFPLNLSDITLAIRIWIMNQLHLVGALRRRVFV